VALFLVNILFIGSWFVWLIINNKICTELYHIATNGFQEDKLAVLRVEKLRNCTFHLQALD
jgi:hypothetical protein